VRVDFASDGLRAKSSKKDDVAYDASSDATRQR